jgi:hypothetical protein
LVIGCVASGVVWGGRRPAFAQDKQAEAKQAEAEKLIRHGVELRRARDDEAAARDFQKAYDLVRTPRAAAQLGLAKQALGLWVDAERFLGEALRAPDDAWVSKNKATLDGAMLTIQSHLARVEVIGDPEGAEVAISGRRVGKLPLAEPVRVGAGQVDVDVTAAGYSPAQRTVTLISGQYQRVVVHLVKLEAAPGTASTVSAAKPLSTPTSLSAATEASSPAAARETSNKASSEQTDHESSGTRSALKWTAAGLAVAGVATGVIGVVMHGNDVSAFDEHPCRNRNGTGVRLDGMADSTCQSLLETFQRDQKIAIAGFVVGGAFAATWLVLLLTEPTPSTRTTAHAARRSLCLPSPEGIGVSCMGHF